jgi:predicted PurR-regulated permease PerM
MQLNLKRWLGAMFALSLSLIVSFVTINHFDIMVSWISKFWSALTPFIVGIVIAYILDPIVKTLTKRLKIKRGIAIALIYLILILILGSFGWLVVPMVVDNAAQIIQDVPRLINQANTQLAESGILSDPTVQDILASIRGQMANWANIVLSNLTQGLIGITSAVFSLFVGIVVSVYTLIDKHRLQASGARLCRALFSEERAEGIFAWTEKIHQIFSKFMTGLIVQAIGVGLLAFIGMTILNVRYAPIFGLLIGLTNVIPYVGPFIGAIPTVGITLLYDPLSALKVAVLILLIQQFDANFMGPRIMGNYIGLRPMWIVLAISLGGTFGGMLGMIMSIPVAAILKILLEHIIEKKEHQKNVNPETTPDVETKA